MVPNLGEWNGYSDCKNAFTVNALQDQRGSCPSKVVAFQSIGAADFQKLGR
jgi:hypothetical protein